MTMTKMIKFLLVTVLSLTILSYMSIAKSSPRDITGTYRCKGHDPYLTNPNFTENLILKKNGDSYKVELIGVDNAIPSNLGIAIFNKNIDNAFAFVYWRPANPDTKGIQFMIIKPDGSLNGTYANSNSKVIGTEVCKKI